MLTIKGNDPKFKADWKTYKTTCVGQKQVKRLQHQKDA